MATWYLFFFLLSSVAVVTFAQVPASEQFKYVNQGEFGDYIVEYDANYRYIAGADALARFPFQVFLYNATPNAYVLALRMGSHRVESTTRWVWEANRNDPVQENATLAFGGDGNLVLADVDGRVVWQTNTANRGVTGITILPTGNLVLHDKKGRFLWQSFDHPTDTLLVGQMLHSAGGPNKIVSRKSDSDGSNGLYSLVVEPNGFLLYMNHGGKLLRYGGWDANYGKMESIALESLPENSNAYAFELSFNYAVANGTQTGITGFIYLARPKYNATYSILKLGSDGNLRVFTYFDKVRSMAWEKTFELFSSNSQTECALPSKCGSLGLCMRGMCVACPQPKGLLGWSNGCAPPKLPPCGKSNGTISIGYYEIEGAEHFLEQYVEGEGPIKVEECRKKCSRDCKCVGFSYNKESSKCRLLPVLDTLTKVSQSSHSVHIKFSK